MDVVSLAVVNAEEAGSVVSPYVFGGFAFAALVVLLVATMMIKVGRD